MKSPYKQIHIKKIPKGDYELINPIPVIIETKEDNYYSARAGHLGIKCPGIGETKQKACKELIDIILTEADDLMNPSRTLRQEDINKLEKIQEYLVKVSN